MQIVALHWLAAAVALVDWREAGESRWRGVGGLTVGWWVTLAVGAERTG